MIAAGVLVLLQLPLGRVAARAEAKPLWVAVSVVEPALYPGGTSSAGNAGLVVLAVRNDVPAS